MPAGRPTEQTLQTNNLAENKAVSYKKLSDLTPDSRTCYVMELDPIYCDVIVTRWEQATGQKATRSALQ